MFLFSIHPINIFYILYQYFLRVFFFYKQEYTAIIPKKKPSEIEVYSEKRKGPFIQLMEMEKSDDELRSLNKNIEPFFYSKEDYATFLTEHLPPAELLWKSRILLESTPRGNILMFYNTYKMGFSYYSDTNGIPYSILNLVAMRYVTIYKCLDFFVDNELTPTPMCESPLIQIHQTKPVKKTVEGSIDSINTNNNAQFAKFKNYKKTAPIGGKDGKDKDKDKDKDKKEMKRNTFISMGKMTNFSFIKTIDKKQMKIRKLLFNDYQDVFNQPNHEEKKMSFLEYKNSRT
jgi:hypothetical protein